MKVHRTEDLFLLSGKTNPKVLSIPFIEQVWISSDIGRVASSREVLSKPPNTGPLGFHREISCKRIGLQLLPLLKLSDMEAPVYMILFVTIPMGIKAT